MTPARRAAWPLPRCCCCPAARPSPTRLTAPAAAARRPPPSHRPPTPTATAACPAERAEPDPDRPVVALDFRLEDDLVTVTGTETVVFTPDLPVDELVFRLVPNGPDSAPAGNRLVVDEVRGDDVAEGRYEDAGAADPGGLYVVELDGELAAGESTEVRARLHADPRAAAASTASGPTTASPGGPAARRCWPGSRASAGREDPFVDLVGETATSPAADTTVTVSAPEDLTVLMTGAQADPSAAAGRPPHLDLDRAGRPRRRRRGGPVHDRGGDDARRRPASPSGVLPDGEPAAAELADWTVDAIADLEAHFGAFPYEHADRRAAARLRRRHRVPEHDPRGDARAALVLVHEVAHSGSTGWSATPSSATRGWTRRSPPGPRPSSTSSRPRRPRRRSALPGEVGGSMADVRATTARTSTSSTARAARRCSRRARPPARRRSTPRSAATSTRTPGRSRRPTTSPRAGRPARGRRRPRPRPRRSARTTCPR